MHLDQKMARTNSNRLAAALAAVCVAAFSCAPPANATRLTPELRAAVEKRFSGARIRLDGSVETKEGELFLPVIPGGGTTSGASTSGATKSAVVTLEEAYPSALKPDALRYSNGWCFLRVLKTGNSGTVISPASLPDKLKKIVLAGKLPADLIVPEHVALAKSWKPIVGDVAIPLGDETLGLVAAPSSGKVGASGTAGTSATNAGKTGNGSGVAAVPNGTNAAGTAPTGAETKPSSADSTAHGVIFVTSPRNGNLLLLDEHTLAKLGEFPTEGIPTSMTAVDGKLYVADQAKSRVSIFDPKKLEFSAHIPLLPRSAPKGIAVLPNAKLLYVSESAASDVAVIELATQKVLMRTKVNAGPARMAVTPNGFQVVVLNPPAGEATIISTLNQRVLATVAVGSMPNAVIISPDSQRAYISNRMSNTVAVLDIIQRKVVHTFKTGTAPTGLALSPDGNHLFVANAKDNTIVVYDLKTKEQTKEIRLPLDVDFPGSLTFMPDGKRIIVSSESTDAIGVLNYDTLEFVSQQPIIGHTSDEVLWMRTE